MGGAGAAWAGVAVAALTLAWAVTLGLLRNALHRTAEDTAQRLQVAQLTKDIAALATGSQVDRAAMLTQMTDDRAATDRRLRWLEEHLWMTWQRGRSPTSPP